MVIASGAWIKILSPELGFSIHTTRQHETFLRPKKNDPLLQQLPIWCLDVATKGWYGFPLHSNGILKVSCHNPMGDVNPDIDRTGDPIQHAQILTFAEQHFRNLALAARNDGQSCFYTMSPNGTFLFDEIPNRPGVFAIGCGSGHAFKFGPLLGKWAADLIEGKAIPDIFCISSKTVGSRTV